MLQYDTYQFLQSFATKPSTDNTIRSAGAVCAVGGTYRHRLAADTGIVLARKKPQVRYYSQFFIRSGQQTFRKGEKSHGMGQEHDFKSTLSYLSTTAGKPDFYRGQFRKRYIHQSANSIAERRNSDPTLGRRNLFGQCRDSSEENYLVSRRSNDITAVLLHLCSVESAKILCQSSRNELPFRQEPRQ